MRSRFLLGFFGQNSSEPVAASRPIRALRFEQPREPLALPQPDVK